ANEILYSPGVDITILLEKLKGLKSGVTRINEVGGNGTRRNGVGRWYPDLLLGVVGTKLVWEICIWVVEHTSKMGIAEWTPQGAFKAL
ncbi:hypothetical protein, partial [Alkalibacillus haloalkaliphilus]|uniref:hypothetical protein n=1 Tax=Alkalibacillus haloalkaliphilus TaxID=94136 RepID=UPI0029356422